MKRASHFLLLCMLVAGCSDMLTEPMPTETISTRIPEVTTAGMPSADYHSPWNYYSLFVVTPAQDVEVDRGGRTVAARWKLQARLADAATRGRGQLDLHPANVPGPSYREQITVHVTGIRIERARLHLIGTATQPGRRGSNQSGVFTATIEIPAGSVHTGGIPVVFGDASVRVDSEPELRWTFSAVVRSTGRNNDAAPLAFGNVKPQPVE